jgi:Ase1/PRC1/MAP65 family protein
MLSEEVKRCEQIKKKNICFPSYTVNTFNEDILELHEDELRDLKVFYENNEAIFTITQEGQELWNQKDLLQNKELDNNRYNNHGGQLLKKREGAQNDRQ